METEKTIDALNKLITINNDRIEGYETASKETDETDLKSLFAHLMATSQKCKRELEAEVLVLAGEPSEGTKASGKFFRAWMDVKAALTGKDRKAILNSCEFGEDAAIKTYENVMEDDAKHFNSHLENLINVQFSLLLADHNTVKSLRDALASA